MASLSEVGYRFGDLWTPSIDNLCFDDVDLISVLERISPAQYYLLTRHAMHNTRGFYEILTKFALVNYPELAAEICEKAAYRAGSAKSIIAEVQHIKLRLENEELEKRYNRSKH